MSDHRSRGAGAVAVVLVLGAAGVWAGSTLATGPAKPKPRPKVNPTVAVRVVARDFSYVLSRTAVPAGRVRFTVVNRGAVAHDFAIGTPENASPPTGPVGGAPGHLRPWRQGCLSLHRARPRRARDARHADGRKGAAAAGDDHEAADHDGAAAVDRARPSGCS